MTPSPDLAAWLKAFETALRPLPADLRADVVREIAGHLNERSEAGGLAPALAAMGRPGDMARPYVEDFQMTEALAGTNPADVVLAVLGRARRSLVALGVAVAGGLFYLLAFSFALITVLKPVTPRNVGLWNRDGHFNFGAVYGTADLGPDLLGYWILPLCVGLSVVCFMAATLAFRTFGRATVRR